MRPPANISRAPIRDRQVERVREEASIALPTVDRSEPVSRFASSPPASGRDFADATTLGRLAVEALAAQSLPSSVEANWAEITAPSTAIASSPATRAIALLTPDAIPAWCSSTAFEDRRGQRRHGRRQAEPEDDSAGSTSVDVVGCTPDAEQQQQPQPADDRAGAHRQPRADPRGERAEARREEEQHQRDRHAASPAASAV